MGKAVTGNGKKRAAPPFEVSGGEIRLHHNEKPP
jgi:hypothetical protein